MANDNIPLWEDGDRITAIVTAAVTGKRFLDVSAARNADGSINVATCGAGARALGVAAFDQATVGGPVTVLAGHDFVLPVTAGAAVTFGQEVQSDATGRAIPWDGTVGSRPNGKAVGSQATVGNDLYIRLY